MEFNNTTDKNGLIQRCETLAKLGDLGITSNAILFQKFTGYLNDSYGKIAAAILTVDKNWRWDDFNWSDPNAFPVATGTLVTGQRDYLMPRATNTANQSTLWKVYKVRILDLNGRWYDLKPLGSDADETDDGSGRPTYYRLLANSIRLSDPPLTGKVTLTLGIQVWFQREFVPFTISDTTHQPGIRSDFHYLMPLEAAATHLMPTDLNLANQYLALFARGLEDVKLAYALRNDDPINTKRMTPAEQNNK